MTVVPLIVALPWVGEVTRVTAVAVPPLRASGIVLFVLFAATLSALSDATGGASARVTLIVYVRVEPS